MKILTSEKPTKRYVAIFNNGLKTHFGQPGGYTYADGASEQTRLAYIARHKAGKENWNDPYSAGALAKHILWSYRSIKTAVGEFNKKFKV
jgi:hypothetical protein